MKSSKSRPLFNWLFRRLFLPTCCFLLTILLLNWNSEEPIRYDKYSNLHPIEVLHLQAQKTFATKLAKQSKTLREAEKEYQRRYHMLPPAGFHQWFQFAQSVNASIIDDYDTIFNDLKPFRSFFRRKCDMNESQNDRLPFLILTRACVKNKQIDFKGVVHKFVLDPLREMTADFVEDLPTMCWEVNYYDEPRVIAPYTDLVKSKKALNKGHSICPKQKFVDMDRKDIWDVVTRSCPPASPARKGSLTGETLVDEPFFVEDTVLSTDICQFNSAPYHGFIRSPATAKIGKILKPVLSPAKLSSFQDILFPSIYRWNSVRDYNETGDLPWNEKLPKLYWRGSTTGGMASNRDWKDFHRQRFVDHVRSKERTDLLQQDKDTAQWVTKKGSMSDFKDKVDVNFTAIIQCLKQVCVNERDHYGLDYRRPASEMWKHKFVFDLDGNSYSGRFYDLLKSRSTVFKQALFREWHDERLVPWLHYVPVSMEMGELGEILNYFTSSGDKIAAEIANAGRDWANRALRREDMQVYMYRLLLEMGRRD